MSCLFLLCKVLWSVNTFDESEGRLRNDNQMSNTFYIIYDYYRRKSKLNNCIDLQKKNLSLEPIIKKGKN